MAVLKFTATGKGVKVGIESPYVSALAISSPTNDLLLDEVNSIVLYGEPYAESLERFPNEQYLGKGLSESYGMAVNAAGTVYASERGVDDVESFDYVTVPGVVMQAPSGVSETAMTLHGTVDPEGEALSECYFEYGTEAGVYTNKVACEQEPKGITGTTGVPVSAALSGLPSAAVRSFRLDAVNAAGATARTHGLTISRPVLSGESVSGVGSVAATVDAQIDTGDLETCYRIEHGLSAAYGAISPEVCVGAGEGASGQQEALSGLQPDTQYHFRVVASNGLGTTFGGDTTFTTFPQTVSGLPDGRVYELVSPVGAGQEAEVYVPSGLVSDALDANGEHGILTNQPFEAAADGEAMAYAGDPPATGGDGNVGDASGNEYVARRGPAGGWTQVAVEPPSGNFYLAFSSDLSIGILDASEEGGNSSAHYNHWFSHPTTGGSFEPLITAAPANRTLAEFGSVLDGKFSSQLEFGGANAGTGAVPAFSHRLFEASAALTADAPEGGLLENNLYDSAGGRMYLINVLPDGEAEANATFGRQGPSGNGFLSPEISNAISDDGSRIFWSAVEAVKVGGGYEERPRALYVRENDTQPQSPLGGEGECTVPADACTMQVDAAESGAKGPSGDGQFWTASSDGSKVFFTDENRLTEDASAAPGEPDLYEYDVQAPEGERLSDLSAGAKPGAHADVQGVLGTSGERLLRVLRRRRCAERRQERRRKRAGCRAAEPVSAPRRRHDVHRDAVRWRRRLHGRHRRQ